MSGWAITSFVLSLAVIPSVISLIIGIISLPRIRRLGQKGRGLAITAVVLSSIWTTIFAVFLAMALVGGLAGTGSAGSAGSAGIDPMALKVGDCFDFPASVSSVKSIVVIPCAKPHSAQVFGKVSLSGSNPAYPGTTAGGGLASKACDAHYVSVDQTKLTSASQETDLFPPQDLWQQDQHTVICVVNDPKPDLTSSVLLAGTAG